MKLVRLTTAALLSVGMTSIACNRTETATEQVQEQATDQFQERIQDQAELEKRVADLDLRWNEMQAKVVDKNRQPTAALHDEVAEDVAAARMAVANLKTTTPDNWWERQEEATTRTLDDIEADVKRFNTRIVSAEVPAANTPVGTTSSFDQQRAQFIDRARARADAFEAALKDVKRDGRLETELEDTRARIDKLQDDLDRLRTVDANAWWETSEKRVGEYIDRVEESIGRLDNDKAAAP